jgi:hypothetical protein
MAVKNSEDSNDSAGDFQKGFAAKATIKLQDHARKCDSRFNRRHGNAEHAENSSYRRDERKDTGKIQIAGAPKNALHNPTAHGDHMIQSSQ